MTSGNNGGNDRDKRFCMMTGKSQRLEDLVEFPADFAFKIMGRTGEIDIEAVMDRMASMVESTIPRDAVQARESSGGKYTSYTVRVYLVEASELTRVYDYLKEEPTVIYYM